MAALSVLLAGAAAGGEYALLVLGFLLTWSATRVVSLAQGAVALAGGYLAGQLQAVAGVPVSAGLAVVAVVFFTAGWALGALAVPGLRGRPVFTVLVTTFGLGLILQGLLSLWFTGRYHSLAGRPGNLITLAVVVGCADGCAVGIALCRGRLGRVMAAVGADREIARTLGIRPRRIEGLATGLGAAYAGVAGVLIGVTGSFHPADAGRYTVICAFVAIAVGMSSPVRGVAAAVLLGLADSLGRHYLGGTAVVVGEIALLALVLLARGAALLPGDEALSESPGLPR